MLGTGAGGDQGLLPLLSAEGSRSSCSCCFSGCNNSAEARISREVTTDQFAHHCFSEAADSA